MLRSIKKLAENRWMLRFTRITENFHHHHDFERFSNMKKYGKFELQRREISTGCIFFRCVEAIRQIFHDNLWCLDLSQKNVVSSGRKELFLSTRSLLTLLNHFDFLNSSSFGFIWWFQWIPLVLMICMHEWFLLVIGVNS